MSAASSVSSLLKQHEHERKERKHRLDRAVEAALIIADDLENNCRAALGMELNNCVTNQHHLDLAIHSLKLHVKGLASKCTNYNQQYDGLVHSINELGSVERYLADTDTSLAKTASNFDYITAKLLSEE